MFLQELLDLGISRVLAVLVLAAAPISELRGAIPVGIIVFNFPWYQAFFLAVIGNLLPVPLLLLFSGAISRRLNRTGLAERIHGWLSGTAKRRGKLIEKYRRIGLTLFVAVPLPVTGAWTGSLIAPFLGLKFRHAFLATLVGVVFAGAIVTAATVLGWSIAGLGDTQAILPVP